LDQIIEEDYDSGLLDDVENNSALDKAQHFVEDFQKSRVEILPTILGSLYA
jgi:hypothetical protein